MRRSNLPVRLALGLLLALGCSTDGGSGPGTGAIALSLASSAATVAQGGASQVAATLTRSGGFSGTVALTVEGVPTGVTGAVSNVVTNGSVTSATVTISVAGATAPGTYNLIVRGTGSGVTAATAPFTLTVTAAPDYTLSIAPATASVAQGASTAPIAVTITRTNFTDAVTLTLGGTVPSGVTAAFTPPAPTGTTASLSITAALATAPGTYNLTVAGTGTPGARSTPLTLTVTAAGGFTLGLTPAGGLAMAQGTSDNSRSVVISRVNYNANVTLTAENLPAGLTAGFAPNPAGNNSVLTLTADGTIAPNLYTITIRGTGPAALRVPGSLASVEATTTLAVTITPGGTPDYSLSVNPGSATIAQGGSQGNLVVTITRVNFPGAVLFSLGGPFPSGVTATFAPPSTSGATTTMTIAVSAVAPPGLYQIQAVGTGGPGQRTTPFTLTITPSP